MPRHVARMQVDRDVGRLESSWVALRGAAQLGSDPRQQLVEVERLGDVVVGAVVEALDHVLLLAQRGEHDHRDLGPVSSNRLEHLEAAATRQHHVEQHQIEVPGQRQCLAAVAVAGDLGRKALGAQRPFEKAGDAHLVLDDQDPHRPIVGSA